MACGLYHVPSLLLPPFLAGAATAPTSLLPQPCDDEARPPAPGPHGFAANIPLQVRPPRIRRHLRRLGPDRADHRVDLDDREDWALSPLRRIQSHAPFPGDPPDVSPRPGGVGPARKVDEPHVPSLPHVPRSHAGPTRLRERADGSDRVPAYRRRPGRHPRRRAGGP